MLGGIIFIIVVWFIPMLIWYIIQGRKEMTSKPSCEASAKEVKNTKIMFYSAIGIGILLIILVLIFG